MIATVNVRLYYQPHCQECMRQVEETVSSAIRDASVSGVSMVSANKCEHDALATPLLNDRQSRLKAASSTPTPTLTPTPAVAEPTLPGIHILNSTHLEAIQ